MVVRLDAMDPKHLQSWRLHMGGGKAISMAEASRQIGCNKTTYIRWEKGLTAIPPYVDLACTALVMGMPRWSKRIL